MNRRGACEHELYRGRIHNAAETHMTGILTTLEASQTILKAIGLIAGPESSACDICEFRLSVSISIAIPGIVFIREIASLPAVSVLFANSAIFDTFGEQFLP